MARSENGRGRRKRKERVVKIKKKKLSQVVMKKARAENVTLKRERHGLLKVLSSILEKSVRRDSHVELSSDVVTIPNQKIGEGTFDVVSIGHVKTLDSFCVVKEGKLSHHFNAIFEARLLQSLAGCDYFP